MSVPRNTSWSRRRGQLAAQSGEKPVWVPTLHQANNIAELEGTSESIALFTERDPEGQGTVPPISWPTRLALENHLPGRSFFGSLTAGIVVPVWTSGRLFLICWATANYGSYHLLPRGVRCSSSKEPSLGKFNLVLPCGLNTSDCHTAESFVCTHPLRVGENFQIWWKDSLKRQCYIRCRKLVSTGSEDKLRIQACLAIYTSHLIMPFRYDTRHSLAHAWHTVSAL